MFKIFVLNLLMITFQTTLSAQTSQQNINNSITENECAKIAIIEKNDIKAYAHLQKAIAFDPNNSTFFNSVAFMAMKQGEFKNSIDYLEKALRIDTKNFGGNHPNVASILNNIGAVYSKLGDKKSALEYFDKAYKIISEYLGEKHPQTANIKRIRDREAEK